MLILGVNASYHDSAAVLLKNGQVVAALGKERINRVRHTSAFPRNAIRYCICEAGISEKDLDLVAVNIAEEMLIREMSREVASQLPPNGLCPMDYAQLLCATTGFELDPTKLRFVPHHVALVPPVVEGHH
jgi:carbamoyltransferase